MASSLRTFIHGSVLDLAAGGVMKFFDRYDPGRVYVFFSACKDNRVRSALHKISRATNNSFTAAKVREWLEMIDRSA